MALAARTFALLIVVLFSHIAVQGQKKGQVLNRTRTLSEDSYRNTTFRYSNHLYSTLSFSHLYTSVNFSHSVTQFNHLTHVFDSHLTKLHSVVNDSYFNSTLSLLRAKLENGADFFKFTCFVTSCNSDISMSKLSLPLISPPSSDELFFRNPRNFDWDSYWGNREKRQALLLSAAALFGGVGFGLYNTAEIQFLKTRLGDENNRIGLLAEKLREVDTSMSRHESRLFTISTKINDILTSSTKIEVDNEVSKVISHFSLALDDVTNHAHSLSDMLIQGKLQPRFFRHDSVTRAFHTISSKARKHHLVMANKELSEILTEATSFHVERSQIFFALHLPLHSEPEFELYEFINTPFSLKNGSAVIISTPHRWLAVNQALSESIILSDEDHKKCLHRRKGLICPTSVTLRSLKSTCLGSLYLGSMEHIAIHCNIVPVDTYSEIVTKLDGNQVAIYSPPHINTVAYVSCPKFNESKQILVRHYEIVQMEESCTLVTPHYIYRTDQQLAISSSFLNRRLVLVDSFQFREVKAHSTLPPFLHHDFRSPLTAPSSSHHTWLLSVIATILMIGLILLLGILPWRIRSTVRRREDKPHQHADGDHGERGDLVDGEHKSPLHLPRPQQVAPRTSRWWPPCIWRRRAGRPERSSSISLTPPSPSGSYRGGDRQGDGHGDGGSQKPIELLEIK